eukprot:g7628.t1
MIEGIRQMEFLQNTITAQKKVLEEQHKAGDNMRAQAAMLQEKLGQSGREPDADNQAGAGAGGSPQRAMPGVSVREVQTPGREKDQEPSASDATIEHLRIILKQQGLELSDVEMAELLQTPRGKALLGKMQVVEQTEGGLDALQTLSESHQDTPGELASLPENMDNLDEAAKATMMDRLVKQKVREAMAAQGINVSDEEFEGVIQSDYGKKLVEQMKGMVQGALGQETGRPPSASQVTDSIPRETLTILRNHLSSAGEEITETQLIEILQSDEGKHLLEKIQQIENLRAGQPAGQPKEGHAGEQLPKEGHGGIKPSPEAILRLKNMLREQGMDVSDDAFLQIMMTPRGQTLLKKLMELEKTEKANEAAAAQVDGSGAAPTSSTEGPSAQFSPRKVALMRGLLEKEGISLPDDKLLMLLQSPEGKNLIDRLEGFGAEEIEGMNTAQASASATNAGAVSDNESLKEGMKKEMRSRGMNFTDEEFEVFAESDKGKAQMQNVMTTLNQGAGPRDDATVGNRKERLLKVLAGRGMALSSSELDEFVKSERGKELLENVETLEQRAEAIQKLQVMLGERGLQLDQAQMLEFIQTEKGQQLLEQVLVIEEEQTNSNQEGGGNDSSNATPENNQTSEASPEPEATVPGAEQQSPKERLRAVFAARGVTLPEEELSEFAQSERGKQLLSQIHLVEQLENNGSPADEGTAPKSDVEELRAVLKSRGYDLSDEELTAITQTEQGKQMLALQLKGILQQKGYDLSDEEVLGIAQTPQGQQILAMINQAHPAGSGGQQPAGVSTAMPTLSPQLQLLKDRLVAQGHAPTDEQVIEVSKTEMGKRLLALLEQTSQPQAPSAEPASAPGPPTATNESVRFIKEILKEKGIEASDEDVEELAKSEHGQRLVGNMRSLKSQQVDALENVPIVQNFREVLESKGIQLDDDGFRELLASDKGRKLLSAYIEENKNLTDGLELSEEQQAELQNSEEGRDMLKKFSKLNIMKSQLTALQSTLDADVNDSPQADAAAGAGDDSAKSLGSEDRLRAILRVRGIELSDEEFQEIVKSDRGQEMLQKIEGLQKVMQDEDDARGNQIAALQQQQHNALANFENGKTDLEAMQQNIQKLGLSGAEAQTLTSKLGELQRLQTMLMSLRDRVENVSGAADSASDEQAVAQMREEFSSLRNAISGISQMANSVQNPVGVAPNNKQSSPQKDSESPARPPRPMDDFDVNSPRPKTSRRVPKPTPEEYTDYMPQSVRAAPPLTEAQTAKYTVEQATIHNDASPPGSNSNRPKTSRRTPRPSPEAFMDYVSPSRKRMRNDASVAPGYQVEMESFEEGNDGPKMFDTQQNFDEAETRADGALAEHIADNALAYFASLGSNNERSVALEQLFDAEAGLDESPNAYGRLRMLSSALILKLFEQNERASAAATDRTGSFSPNSTLHLELDNIVSRSDGHMDFVILLLRELRRSPTYDDSFRMKCLRFFAESQNDGGPGLGNTLQDRVLNAPIHNSSRNASPPRGSPISIRSHHSPMSTNGRLSPGSIRPSQQRNTSRRGAESKNNVADEDSSDEDDMGKSQHHFVQQMELAPTMSPNPRSKFPLSPTRSKSPNMRYAKKKRQDTAPGKKKENFPRNMPFDYVENVRASVASSVATELDHDLKGRNSMALASSSAEGSSPDPSDDEYDVSELEENADDWRSSSVPSRNPSSVDMGMGSDDEDQVDLFEIDGNGENGWHQDGAEKHHVVPSVKTKARWQEKNLSKYEQIVRTVRKKLPEVVDSLGEGTMTRATLMRVRSSILREVRAQHDSLFRNRQAPPKWSGPGSLSRTGPLLDPQLKKSIEKSFTKYEGLNAPVHKDELIQDISDILYDELVFHNIVRQLEASYTKDLSELDELRGKIGEQGYNEAVDRLVEQKQKDLRALEEERRTRLSGESANFARSTANRTPRSTDFSSTDDGGEESDGTDFASQAEGSKSLTRMSRTDNLERSPQAAAIVKRVLNEQFREAGIGQGVDSNDAGEDGFVDMGTLKLPNETPSLQQYIDVPENISLSEGRRSELRQRFEDEAARDNLHANLKEQEDGAGRHTANGDVVLMTPDEYDAMNETPPDSAPKSKKTSATKSSGSKKKKRGKGLKPKSKRKHR